MTEAKQHLMKMSQRPIDKWICKHYNELCKGMTVWDARMCKPTNLKLDAFNQAVEERCVKTRKIIDGVKKTVFILKDEVRSIYKQESESEDDIDSFL